MIAILDLPEVRRRVSRLSVAEYHRLGELTENGKRTELIRGLLIEKKSKSPLHTSIARRLFRLLLPVIPSGYFISKEEPLTLRDSEPEPDFAVVRGSEDEFRGAHPTTAALVIEVAVSSVDLDRELASVYAEAGVDEYWIVLARNRAVEVYRRPENGQYQEKTVVEGNCPLASVALPGVAVALPDLFT